MSVQISLPIRLQDWASLDNYFLPDESPNIALLKSLESEDWQVIYVHGADGSGKTHLLQASCRFRQDEKGEGVIYLPMQELAQSSSEVLQGLDRLDFLALDDIGSIAGQPEWEESLFHLFNALQQRGARILFAGQSVPTELPLQLADLRSRVLSGTSWRLEQLDEESLRNALVKRAERLGLTLTSQVLDYLFSRYSRDSRTLFELLEQLDRYAFDQQRQITLPLIRSYLQERISS